MKTGLFASAINLFIWVSTGFFAWWLFGFLSFFPSIDGLTPRMGLFVGSICLFCSFGLLLSTTNLFHLYKKFKLLALLPSVILFPVVCYLVDPISLILPLFAIPLACRNISSASKAAK